MIARTLLLGPVLSASVLFAQKASLKQGDPFPRAIKNAQGESFSVVDGFVDGNGRPVLFVQEGLARKVVRLDAALQPSETLGLSQLVYDGRKWDGVACVIGDGAMRVLLVSNSKKTCDYGIAEVGTSGTLAITDFHQVATFDQVFAFDPEAAVARRNLPDFIIYDQGTMYADNERIVRSPDGSHCLISYYTRDQKGQKKFWFACLDKDFHSEWNGMKDLPFADLKSIARQIALDNAGRILVLSYVFACDSPDRAADKNCHELHLTVISDKGTKVKDLLVDKDFVSSARMRPLADSKIVLALRYGALTGKAGVVLQVDTAITKLKNTPLVDQRVPAIRKLKLTTFGMPPSESGKKTTSTRATAKVPDEVVDVLPAWDGGAVLIEEFHDPEMQISMGEAIAMRHLDGAIRVTSIDAKDSVRWQRTIDRAYMTTLGEAYETIGCAMTNSGLVIADARTLGGMTAIGKQPEEETGKKSKKDKDKVKPAEPSETHVTMIARDGSVAFDQSPSGVSKGYSPCPIGMIADPPHHKLWLPLSDGDKMHAFAEVDLGSLLK